MKNINNKYNGQYESNRKLSGTFDAYWSLYGYDIEHKNPAIKAVIRSIYNILNDDLKYSLDDQNKNQTIFDRVEFRELCNVVSKLLDQYIDVKESDVKYTPDIIQQKLTNAIQKEFVNHLEKIKGDQTNFENIQVDDKIKTQIFDVLTEFFSEQSEKSESKESSTPEKTTKSKQEKDKTKAVRRQNKNNRKQKKKTSGRSIKDRNRNKLKQIQSEKNFLDKMYDGKTQGVQTYGEEKKKRLINEINKISQQTIKSLDVKLNIANNTIYDKTAALFKSTKNKVSYAFRYATVLPKRKVQNFKRKIDGVLNTKLMKGIFTTFKVIGTGLSKATKDLKKMSSFVVKSLSFVLSPVTKLLSPIFNAIRHPIKSLCKFLSGDGFLAKFFLGAFKNPANAFMFGVFAGAVTVFMSKIILPVVHEYITLPLLKCINFTLELFNPKKEGNIIGYIKTVFNIIRPIFSFLWDILKGGATSSGDLITTILVNLGERVGVKLDKGLLFFMLNTAGRVLSGYKRLAMQSPYLSGALKGAGTLGLIAALWAGQSDLFGRSYAVEEDKDGKNGKLVPINRIDDGDTIEGTKPIDTFELKQKMSDIIKNEDVFDNQDSNITYENMLWVQNISNKIENEQSELFRLSELLKDSIRKKAPISEKNYKQFITSEEFDDTNEVTEISKEIITKNFNSPSYSSLPTSLQYQLLADIIKLRFSRLTYIRNKSEDAAQLMILKKLHEDGKLKLSPEYIEKNNFDLNLTTDGISFSSTNAEQLSLFPYQFPLNDFQRNENRIGNKSFHFDSNSTNVSELVGYIQKNGILFDSDDGKNELVEYLRSRGVDPTKQIVEGDYNKKQVVRAVYNTNSPQFKQAITDYFVNKSFEQRQIAIDRNVFQIVTQTFPEATVIGDELFLSDSHEDNLRAIERIIPNYSMQTVAENLKQLNDKIISAKLNPEKLKKIKERLIELTKQNNILMINQKRRVPTELDGEGKNGK